VSGAGAGARPPPVLGHDGAITLLATLALAVSSLGVAPLLAALAVRRTAHGAPLAPTVAPARILVLGHRLEAGSPSAEFLARLARALALARAHPGARVLVLGGATPPGAPAEAEVGRAWLVAQGLPAGRIGVETASRHTLENLRHHREAGHAPGPEALVTSRLHLHRALLMARGLGLAPEPAAAEATVPRAPLRLAAEGFMVLWYLTGRWLARALRRRAWMARIG